MWIVSRLLAEKAEGEQMERGPVARRSGRPRTILQ